jgi:hypothetical protein
MQKQPRKPSGLIFSRQLSLNYIAPKKNSENFRILQSHNLLSAKRLHNCNYLQLTMVRLRHSDWQSFRTFVSPPSHLVVAAAAQAEAFSFDP